MKALLILGAGVMQGPAIRIAKSKGYRVYAADGNPVAPEARSADHFLHIDLKDKDALALAAAEIDGLAGVMTAGTDFSASVAWVAQRLGLPGLPYEVALDASDKARMRARLAAGGVPVPAFAYGTGADDPELLAGRVAPLPLVVKPVDNMGSRGCRLARTMPELREAWADAVRHSRSGKAIIEAYLQGPEFSLDAIVHDGHVVLRGIADRVVVFEPFFVEMGHTIPSSYGKEIIDEVVAVFEAGIKALGITNGAAKGDIKYTRNGAFVGEIAARLSGGYMSGWTYPYSSGVEATAEAIDLACGVVPEFPAHAHELVCSERAWISIPGKVSEVFGLENATRMSCVRDLFSRAVPGDRVVFPCNNVEKCGNILAVAPSSLEADSAAENAARSVLLRLEPDDTETAAFLRGEGRVTSPAGAVWPPVAYDGISAMTISSLDKMPDMVRLSPAAATFSIAPLHGTELESAVDWQGRSLAESLEAVATMTGVSVGLHGDLVFGSSFWRALFKGGYQAGAWLIDNTQARLAEQNT
jgi:biotin carboxylase